MESSPQRLNDQLKQVLRLRRSQKTSIFLVCVVIASLFWLLNAFSKDYATIVDLPVRYTNLPEDQVLTSELPQQLAVELRGYGFDLLSYLLGTADDTLVVNGNDLISSRKNPNTVLYSTRPLFERMAGQLNPGVQLKGILTDTLRFRVEERITRLVPVKANVQLQLATQYLEAGQRLIDPPVIELSGPRSAVVQVREINTEVLQLDNVNADVKQQLALEIPSGSNRFEMKPSNVALQIPVDKFTDASIDLPVTVENLPESLSLNLIPDTVTLNYQVALGRYSEVKHEDFRLVVDFAEFNEKHHKKLRVRVEQSPAFISNPSLAPKKVEFILKR
ncbi:MAG: YbbR-like domain-containing protein [Salibacteraceae bacterium]